MIELVRNAGASARVADDADGTRESGLGSRPIVAGEAGVAVAGEGAGEIAHVDEAAAVAAGVGNVEIAVRVHGDPLRGRARDLGGQSVPRAAADDGVDGAVQVN